MAYDQTEFMQIVDRVNNNDATLTKLSLALRGLDDDDMHTLAKALKNNSTITEIDLGMNQIGDTGATVLAEALEHLTPLSSLAMHDNPFGNEGRKALVDHLREHKNLVRVIEVASPLSRRNMSKPIVLELLEWVKSFDANEHDSLEDLMKAAERLPAMRYLADDNTKPHLQKFENFLDALPTPDITQQNATSAINVQQGDYSAADNPLTWLRLDKTIQQLNTAGLFLQGDALLGNDGKPTEIFQRILETESTYLLFTEENWKGASKEDIRAVMRHVPEEQQARIPNRHQLMASLESDTQKQGLG